MYGVGIFFNHIEMSTTFGMAHNKSFGLSQHGKKEKEREKFINKFIRGSDFVEN